jgi:hypothetical protein
MGQPDKDRQEQDSWDRKAGTVHPGQDCQDRTAGLEQPEQGKHEGQNNFCKKLLSIFFQNRKLACHIKGLFTGGHFKKFKFFSFYIAEPFFAERGRTC